MQDSTTNQLISINKPVPVNDTLSGDTLPMINDSLNIDTLPTHRNFTFDSLVELKQIDPSVNLEIVYRNQPIPNWIIILLVLIFALLAAIKAEFGHSTGKLIAAMFNRTALSKLYSEKVASTIFNVNIFLDLLFYINLSFLAYFFSCTYELFEINGLLLYLMILISLTVFIEAKMFLYKMIGNVFNGRVATNELLFCLFSGNRVSGIFLTAIVLISATMSDFAPQFILGLGIAIVLFFYINSLLKGIWIIAKKVLSVYYLILYLCTLEILPLLIVAKLVMDW